MCTPADRQWAVWQAEFFSLQWEEIASTGKVSSLLPVRTGLGQGEDQRSDSLSPRLAKGAGG